MPIAQNRYADNLDDLVSEDDASIPDRHSPVITETDDRVTLDADAQLSPPLSSQRTAPDKTNGMSRAPSILEVGVDDNTVVEGRKERSLLIPPNSRTVNLECVDGSTHSIYVTKQMNLLDLRELCKIDDEQITIYDQEKIVDSEPAMNAFRKRLWAGKRPRKVELHRYINDPDDGPSDVFFNGKMNGATRG